MAAQCVTKVELNVSCANLLDKDIGSKSDPLCVLFLSTSGQQWYEVERTERIKNCLSPSFSKTFIIDYYFEVVQKLRFGVYDIDNKTIELSDDDFLGECECTLGQIVSSKKLTRPLVLKNGRPAGKGSITVSRRRPPPQGSAGHSPPAGAQSRLASHPAGRRSRDVRAVHANEEDPPSPLRLSCPQGQAS